MFVRLFGPLMDFPHHIQYRTTYGLNVSVGCGRKLHLCGPFPIERMVFARSDSGSSTECQCHPSSLMVHSSSRLSILVCQVIPSIDETPFANRENHGLEGLSRKPSGICPIRRTVPPSFFILFVFCRFGKYVVDFAISFDPFVLSDCNCLFRTIGNNSFIVIRVFPRRRNGT